MDNINLVLDGYFKAWNDGFVSKNADAIRDYMSKAFSGFWANANLDSPEQYDYSYDLEGVLSQYNGDVEKSFEPITIVKRNNGQEYLVLGRETNMINGKPHPAQCMFVWRLEESEWKLVREYIELE